MNRRDFSALIGVAGAGLGGIGSGSALAQGGPVEGTHYVRLSPPASVLAPAGKIEVVEFFWYGCPHCNALEPTLDAWLKTLPADVAFRRVPVGFSAVHESHQRLFYALEAMGQLEALHKRVFAAIHTQQQRLDKESDQAAFVTKNGGDGAKFTEMLKSFSVQTKAKQAKQLSAAYKIDGVPALGVQGRFYTAGSLAGGNSQALAVTNFLIDRVRKSG
jgi:protein dithiol oxidoreductase (disulfide-forming)